MAALTIMSATGGAKTQALVVSTVLSCLLAGYGYSFWQWQKQAELSNTVVSQSSPQPVKADAGADKSWIAAFFGQAVQAPVAEAVKETNLSLKLQASFVSEGGHSAAVLVGGERKQQLFFDGDEVMPGVQLVRVQARRVLIKRNGVLESISLVGDEKPASSVAAAAPVPVKNELLPAQDAAAPAPIAPALRSDLLEKLNKLKTVTAGNI